MCVKLHLRGTVGVRNKFCAVCAKGKEHTCFKNWKEASSSMETDIVLAGFKMASFK